MSTADRFAGTGPAHPRPGERVQKLRYFAWLYSPSVQRETLQALCAIESEINASLRPGVDHQVAHIRLQWWEDELERLAGGSPVHPLTRQLAATLGGPANALDLQGLIRTAIWDLANVPFETRTELRNYCRQWASAMIAPVAAQALPEKPAALDTLGELIRESEMLLTLRRDAHGGRIRLPLNELADAGLEPGALTQPPWPAPLANLLRERFETTRSLLGEALLSLAGPVRAQLRGLTVWASLARRQLERAERALPQEPSETRWQALADSWFAWRAARRAAEGVE